MMQAIPFIIGGLLLVGVVPFAVGGPLMFALFGNRITRLAAERWIKVFNRLPDDRWPEAFRQIAFKGVKPFLAEAVFALIRGVIALLMLWFYLNESDADYSRITWILVPGVPYLVSVIVLLLNHKLFTLQPPIKDILRLSLFYILALGITTGVLWILLAGTVPKYNYFQKPENVVAFTGTFALIWHVLGRGTLYAMLNTSLPNERIASGTAGLMKSLFALRPELTLHILDRMFTDEDPQINAFGTRWLKELAPDRKIESLLES